MKSLQIKTWVSPTALTLISIIAGAYLLFGQEPNHNFVDNGAIEIDAEMLEYFKIQAEKYAKEGSESSATQPSKQSDQI